MKIGGLLVALVAATCVAQQQSESTAIVPFVGCPSDGQLGPQPAPHGRARLVHVSAESAKHLAYFRGPDGIGVLGPRGWHCFENYGSNGRSLYVSPSPIGSQQLVGDTWKGFSGPAIQLSYSQGDTSGRFEVAKIAARVFPAFSSYVSDVESQGITPQFARGPFPRDIVAYRNKRLLEFTTPPHSEGLGTQSRLSANDSAIQGFAMLVGEEPSLIHLSLRLPPELASLAPVIIREAERAQAFK